MGWEKWGSTAGKLRGPTHPKEGINIAQIWRPVHPASRPIIHQPNIIYIHAGLLAVRPDHQPLDHIQHAGSTYSVSNPPVTTFMTF